MIDNNKLIQVFGTQDLVNLFVDMEDALQNKILSKSFKTASKILIDTARGNLGGRYKRVSKSLGFTFTKRTKTLNVGAKKKDGGWMAHWADSGTKERSYKTKNGKTHRTGRVIGTNFWKNANKSTESDIENVTYKNIKSEFDKLIVKRNKIKK